MTSREAILAAVRQRQPGPPPALPEVPHFHKATRSCLEDFSQAVVRMGGKPPISHDGDVEKLICSLFPHAQVICSATPEVTGTRALTGADDPADLEDVDVGIVRAAFGIAETGSVWLSEDELKVNALAYLAQHLVVLLDPKHIVGNLHDAYRDRRFTAARYAVLMTGPSATADIEGVLIHGAQGVRSLTVVLAGSPTAGHATTLIG